MLRFNNVLTSHCAGWLLQLALLAVFGNPHALAQNSQHSENSSDSAEAVIETRNALIPEGRGAVDFYPHAGEPDENAQAWRLSDAVVQYPVDPVKRLRPLFELGDPFLGNGPIRPGIKTPAGQMLQPWFLLFGTFRSAFQRFDQGDQRTSEWSNRFDLHGNLNLSGTERLLFSMRPLDSVSGSYTGFNFEPDREDGWREDFNARLTRLYFEGELGEIFPVLDPADSGTWDIGFSIGRQPVQLQDGLLLNDTIDMVGITRNSLTLNGISNLRITGFYAWNHINRGNNDLAANEYRSADLFGLASEADTAWNNTLALDFLYVRDRRDENAWYLGAASTQRFGALNTTFRVNASIPQHRASQNVGSGVLLLSQLSIALTGSDHIAYFNTFWNIGRFTSASRAPDQGSPAANLGILFDPVGMGRYGVPLGQPIENTIAAAVGYQMFLGDGVDTQLIVEIGAHTSTRRSRDEGMLGFGARLQRAIGKRHVLRLDSFVAGEDGGEISYGLRTEWMIKF